MTTHVDEIFTKIELFDHVVETVRVPPDSRRHLLQPLHIEPLQVGVLELAAVFVALVLVTFHKYYHSMHALVTIVYRVSHGWAQKKSIQTSGAIFQKTLLLLTTLKVVKSKSGLIFLIFPLLNRFSDLF